MVGIWAVPGAKVGFLLVRNLHSAFGVLAFPLLVAWRGGRMSEMSSLFGSYGLRSLLETFRQRSKAGAVAKDKPAPVFGKRQQPPLQSVSLQCTRLSHLRSELQVLFEDEAFPDEAPRFALGGDQEKPRLFIGDSAVVMVDSETGHLIFQEETAFSGVIVVTASEERLLDHIVCHLAAGADTVGPEIYDKAAKMLVGQTLAEVERRVILQTLRHCHGNRTRTAQMLGISLRTVRNKLRECWLSADSAEARQ